MPISVANWTTDADKQVNDAIDNCTSTSDNLSKDLAIWILIYVHLSILKFFVLITLSQTNAFYSILVFF